MPRSNEITAIIEHNKTRLLGTRKMRCHCWNTNIDRWQKTLVVTLVKTKTIVNTIYKLVFKIKRQLCQQYWWILSELGSYLFTSLSNKLISALVWSCCFLNISCCDTKSCCCCCCCCSCISRIISLWFGPFIHSKDRLGTGIQRLPFKVLATLSQISLLCDEPFLVLNGFSETTSLHNRTSCSLVQYITLLREKKKCVLVCCQWRT